MCVVVLMAAFENARQIDRGENGRRAITTVKVSTQLTEHIVIGRRLVAHHVAMLIQVVRLNVGIGAVLNQRSHQVINQLQLVSTLAYVYQLNAMIQQVVRVNLIIRVVKVNARIVRIQEAVLDQFDQQALDKVVLFELTR